jgi:peptidylprolyl isomerase domain and WD repeat-containing protein 1
MLCATVSEIDKSLKVFDIPNYDLMLMMSLDFVPSGIMDWCYRESCNNKIIAVGIKEKCEIHIIDIQSTGPPIYIITIHKAIVTALRYNKSFHTVVSIDKNGIIEYWRPEDGSFPKSEVLFNMKLKTNLFDMRKKSTYSKSLDISPDGRHVVFFSLDRIIRIFKFQTGKLSHVYDETLTTIRDVRSIVSESSSFYLNPFNFTKKMTIEHIINNDTTAYRVSTSNVVFDGTGNFILYPTFFGIKCVNLISNKVNRLIGRLEEDERFLHIALYQDYTSMKTIVKRSTALENNFFKDPTIAALAYKKTRFYLFTQREPIERVSDITARDICNERESENKIITKKKEKTHEILNSNIVIYTSKGEIWIELYSKECPRTIENLITHAKNGFYRGLIFHRVIKGFMIQTGDPLGDGTGGKSIWGNDFEDEIVKNLCHDVAGTVSMANIGPDSNGSQFFITTIPCPWLDGKHTVFGRVVKGMNVVHSIEGVKVDSNDKQGHGSQEGGAEESDPRRKGARGCGGSL